MASTEHYDQVALSEILPQALAVILEAHKAIYYYIKKPGALDPIKKPDGSWVTKADLDSNDILEQGLQKITPGVPVISEENDVTAENAIGPYWLVDPLDGTQMFKTGVEVFGGTIRDCGILVAFMDEARPKISIVDQLGMGLITFSRDGIGTYKARAFHLNEQFQVSTLEQDLLNNPDIDPPLKMVPANGQSPLATSFNKSQYTSTIYDGVWAVLHEIYGLELEDVPQRHTKIMGHLSAIDGKNPEHLRDIHIQYSDRYGIDVHDVAAFVGLANGAGGVAIKIKEEGQLTFPDPRGKVPGYAILHATHIPKL